MSHMPIVIREEYLTLMDGDDCAAAILNAFEMWSKNKPAYIYKSVKQMHSDFMKVYGKNRIGAAFKKLRDRGFLLARNNPEISQDQTLQYLFQPLVIVRAMFGRLLKSLNLQTLLKVFQTLKIKSGNLDKGNESESISETKSEDKSESNSKIISDGGERDFEPEGIDQSKFFQDDPSPNAEDVPQYLRRQVPSAAVRQQLSAYSLSLGLKLYAEVMTRCANARSWEYVLKALANEPIPSPRFASPPSPAADAPTEPDWTEDDIPGNDTPVIDDDIFAKPVAVEDVRQAWLKAHVAPALLANGGVQW